MTRRREVILVGGAAAVAASVPARAGLDDALGRAGWRELTFKNKQPNRFAVEGADGVRVETNGTVSLIYRPASADLASTPILAWRWRVDAAPPPTDLTRKGGDDRPLAVYVSFAYDPARAGVGERLKRAAASITSDRPLPGRLLVYTWGGDGRAQGWFDSPYIKQFSKMQALRGPDAPLGQWVEERVDLLADHQAAFGQPPTAPTEISVSADSDDTKSRSVGLVADLRFAPAGG